MNKNTNFGMWGERGLVGTFFADLYQKAKIGHIEIINDFLNTVQFPSIASKITELPVEAHFIIEPDFSNTGFGHPDAIFSVVYESNRIIVIVEAKRVNFEKACVPSSQRGQEGFNSKLNGQLELDYCLARALSQFKDGDTKLTEPEWVLSTPYSQNRDNKGKLRSVHNPNVLKQLATLFRGQHMDRYYYLIITTDKQNPLDKVNKVFLPEIFKPQLIGDNLTFPNCWMEFRKQFGWLNYEKMEEFIINIQHQLPLGSLFLPTYELNKGNFNVIEPSLELPEPEGVYYYNEFIPLWEDNYNFTIVYGSKGYSAQHKGSPRLWIFKDRLRIAPAHINPLNDKLCEIMNKHFSMVRGKSILKFNSPELSRDKFEIFVRDVKNICQQQDC